MGERLDVYLSRLLGHLSRSQVQALVRSGAVRLNGSPANPSARLRAGDLVCYPRVPLPGAQSSPEPEDIPLAVVYEDADLVVLDKPAGLVVHPSPGHATGTLVNALLARFPELRGQEGERPGIVHRLDKDTSGLMLVARTERALRALQHELRERRVEKEYTLLCCGLLSPPSGRIEGNIGRDPRNPLRMAVVSSGRDALTEYETVRTCTGVQSNAPTYTLARARIHTGRTHQIRVHFSSLGHPIAGDALYGRCAAPGLDRQFLHASRLALRLPSGEWREWRSPLPPDLRATLHRLGMA